MSDYSNNNELVNDQLDMDEMSGYEMPEDPAGRYKFQIIRMLPSKDGQGFSVVGAIIACDPQPRDITNKKNPGTVQGVVGTEIMSYIATKFSGRNGAEQMKKTNFEFHRALGVKPGELKTLGDYIGKTFWAVVRTSQQSDGTMRPQIVPGGFIPKKNDEE